MDLENVLHIAPHSIANAYNMFDPRTGAASGVFVLNNLSNPVWVICAHDRCPRERHVAGDRQALRAISRSGAEHGRTSTICRFPFNPFLTADPPAYMLRYTEHRLMPENEGQPPPPATDPPAVSAYTGHAATYRRRPATATAGPPPPMAPDPRYRRRRCRTCSCRRRRTAAATGSPPPTSDGTPP